MDSVGYDGGIGGSCGYINGVGYGTGNGDCLCSIVGNAGEEDGIGYGYIAQLFNTWSNGAGKDSCGGGGFGDHCGQGNEDGTGECNIGGVSGC